MKKIEEEFIKGLDKSFEYNKSFDDIKDKINIVRFQKVNTGSSKALNRICGAVIAFVLFVAIVIPVTIYIFNTNGLNSGLGGNDTADGNPPKDNDPPTGGLPDYEGDKKLSYRLTKSEAVQFLSSDTSYDVTSILLVHNAEANDKVLDDMTANQTGAIYPNLVELLSNEKFDEAYFEANSIVVCPFVYSSSERDIELTNCYVDAKENSLNLHFSLYSPEYVDNDLWIEFFLLEIKKESLVGADNLTGKIHVLNTRDNSNRSAYYGLK